MSMFSTSWDSTFISLPLDRRSTNRDLGRFGNLDDLQRPSLKERVPCSQGGDNALSEECAPADVAGLEVLQQRLARVAATQPVVFRGPPPKRSGFRRLGAQGQRSGG